MGITSNCAKFLFYSKSQGISFRDTLMLGRLHLYATKNDIVSCINKFKNNEKNLDDVKFIDEYSEPLFEILGARSINSLDYSDYEKATIIHDLNLPLPEKYHNSFSAIVDGGTIEHVFNFPVAIKNCMNALKVGGHYLGITPANNEMGHGFYQFSPELYLRVFSPENGFRVKKIFIYASTGNSENITWYEVADPKDVKDRVSIINSSPTYLLIIAEKISDKILSIIPHQSDYVNAWVINASLHKKITEQEGLISVYRKFFPKRIKIIMRNIYNILNKEQADNVDLGTINPIHFKKFEL